MVLLSDDLVSGREEIGENDIPLFVLSGNFLLFVCLLVDAR